jgi:hypothetical protein
MTGIIILIVFLGIYPVWLFVKLARYGENILFPDFERIQRKVNEWTGLYYDGRFAYNQPVGKLIYYLRLLYLIGAIGFIIYSLAF